MIEARFVRLPAPLARPKGGYKRGTFTSRWQKDLERELEHLSARRIVVQVDLQSGEIRNDGWPRSTARPRTPGVVVGFDSRHGPLTYTCATYDSWEANIRAISLTLSALRAVTRYGAVKGSEQYKGFRALPEGEARAPIQAETFASVEDAARHLIAVAGYRGFHPERGPTLVCDDPEVLSRLYRDAAKKAHPDAGGTAEAMAKVNAARDMIERHTTVGVG